MVIDVIIPTFNRAVLLKRAVESVLAQTYQMFHLHVVNDGSTDETDSVMEKFLSDQRVHYLKQKNKGVSGARNFGIHQSQAEWIAFLDSDDQWMPSKLQEQVHFILKNPHLRFVHTNEIWMRNNVRVNPKKKFDKSHDEIFKRSLETCLISPSTVMMKRELAQTHGNFDEKFIICEDYDLWLKILATEEIGFLPQYLVTKYGGHQDQLSTQYPAMDYWRLLSLNSLLKMEIAEEKKTMVRDEIAKKAPILLQGYEKYSNVERAEEIRKILESI